MKKFIILTFLISSLIKAQPVMYNQEFQVNTYTDSDQFRSTVCGLSDSGFVICWASDGQDGDSFGIFAQLYNHDATKRGEEFQVNTYVESEQSFPSVFGFPDGGFIMCWASFDQDGSNSGIFGQLYENDGTKRGQEFQVNTETNFDQFWPSVSVLSDGGFVVCWESWEQDGSEHGIFGQIFENSGAKRGEEFQINTYVDGWQVRASVCGLADSGFVVCWSSDQQDGDSWGIFGQRYENNGAKRGKEFQINSYIDHDQVSSALCALTGGGFVVCWSSDEQDGDSWGIFGQIYEQDGEKRGEEFLINTNESGQQYGPAVSGLSDGGFAVFWRSIHQDGDWDGVFGKIYDNTGTVFGKEFQVNTYIKSGQTEPEVSGLPNGDFVVCWESWNQDGSRAGIFAKYYLGSPITHRLYNFSLISPLFDATLDSINVNFRWQQTSLIHKNFPWELEYELYIDTLEEFYDPEIFLDIYDSSLTVENLTPGQTYFWKVLAKNIEGDSLWSSETYGFYIDPAANIDDAPMLKPETFKLYHNYPNPFNPTTAIGYRLPAISDVKLSIYNVLGEKVITLVSERQNAGNHQIEWNASNYSSGEYFLILEAGNFRTSQKMLLIK